eukprot:3395938-Pyramimonas_sp.AAC.1
MSHWCDGSGHTRDILDTGLVWFPAVGPDGGQAAARVQAARGGGARGGVPSYGVSDGQREPGPPLPVVGHGDV